MTETDDLRERIARLEEQVASLIRSRDYVNYECWKLMSPEYQKKYLEERGWDAYPIPQGGT